MLFPTTGAVNHPQAVHRSIPRTGAPESWARGQSLGSSRSGLPPQTAPPGASGVPALPGGCSHAHPGEGEGTCLCQPQPMEICRIANAGQLPRGGAALVRGCGHWPWPGSSSCGTEAKLAVIHCLAWPPPGDSLAFPTWEISSHPLAWLPSGSLWANFKVSVLLQVAEALQPGLKPTWGLVYWFIYSLASS